MTKAFGFSIVLSDCNRLLLLYLPYFAAAQNPPQTPPPVHRMMSAPQTSQADSKISLHSSCSSFPPSKPPRSMTTTPTANSLTSPKTSDRAPPARPKPAPPPNTSPPNFASSASKSASSPSPSHTGCAAPKPPPWSSIPAWFPSTTQKIVLTALGGSSSTPPDGLTADVVTVDTFDELQALGRDKVAGKIVLFNELFDKQKAAAGLAFAAYGEAVRYRGAGPKAAADLGAVAALVRSVGSADYRLPHTGFSFPAGIPAAAVTAEDADLIVHLPPKAKSACI